MGDFNSRIGQLHELFSADEFQSHLHKCDEIFKTGIETRNIVFFFFDFQIPLHRIVKDIHLKNFVYNLVDFLKIMTYIS